MTQNIEIRESQKTGKKTIVIGAQAAHYDTTTKTYTSLKSLGLRITSYGYTQHDGKVIKYMKMALSNVHFEAQEAKDGGVHFVVSAINARAIESDTAEFMMNQKVDGLKNAKKYIMKKFGKDIKWADFEELCQKVYGDSIAEKEAKKEAKEAARQAHDAKQKEILAHIAM